MKKALIAIITISVIFCFASCGNKDSQGSQDKVDDGENFYKVYSDKAKTIRDADELDIDINSDFSLEMDGENYDQSTTGNVLISKKGDKLNFKGALDVKKSSMEYLVMVYYKDEMLYTNTDGEKHINNTDPFESFPETAITAYDFPESALKEVSENDDGTYLFIFDGNELGSLGQEILSSVNQQAKGLYYMNYDINLGDVRMTVEYGKNKNIKSIKTEFPAFISSKDNESETFTATCKTKLTINALSNIEISFPDDLEAYGNI